jgi:parallel beta-helix repeat protein
MDFQCSPSSVLIILEYEITRLSIKVIYWLNQLGLGESELLKKPVSGIMLTLILIGMLMLAFNIQPVKTEPAIIIVPEDYPTIQEAINAASPGSIIYVKAGIYKGPQVTINKPLQLVGENKSTTIIDGLGSWVCVYVQSTNNVNITGFTIQNGYGIYLWDSENVTVSGNIVSDNGQGIVIGESANNTVSKNIITLNGAISIFLTGSNSNEISKNIVTLNNGDAIWLDNSNGNTIVENNVSRNGLGTLPGYHAWGIRLDWSNSNIIYHNNIIDNYEQAFTWGGSANNSWDDGYPSGGNYWSDYTGTDLFGGPYQNVTGSDGVGDTPYVIDANNTDHYPLMQPWIAPWLRLTMTLEKTEYVLGEPVNIMLTITNISNQTITFGLYWANDFDFRVYNDINNPIYQWSDRWIGVAHPAIVRLVTLNPRESLSENLSWQQTNDGGVPVSPGTYYIIGRIGGPSGTYYGTISMIETFSPIWITIFQPLSFVPLKTVVGRGCDLPLNVVITNIDDSTETFNVTLCVNTTVIGTETDVNIPNGTSKTLSFAWDTASFDLGYYKVNALAGNLTAGSSIVLTIPGDVDGDFGVELADLVLIAKAYGSRPTDSNWNPNADIDGNGVVGLSDLVTAAKYYGQHYP